MSKQNEKSRYITLTGELLEAFSALPYYSPLPGERELGEVFGVSRPTIRKALKILEDERKVIRIQGRGSFYLGNKRLVDSDKSSNIILYDEGFEQDAYSKAKIITQNIEKANEEIADKLKIKEGDEVFHLERLLYMKDNFNILSDAYVPYKLCPSLIDIDFHNTSLYIKLLENSIVPYRIEQTLTTVSCNEYEMRHLGISLNDPISFLQIVTLGESGTVIEYSTNRAPAYKTKYEMAYIIPKAENIEGAASKEADQKK
ncbi:GntR family transcriptional regulator [Clostridium polynesiense]|uniref:GntR family transcriptional regulator n=1 Tax=Clostridium polynesiense TaxID=1325933 RepID=UPI000693B39D|nr:GntR family transcriptional regulator [Clostridium polynesiense]